MGWLQEVVAWFAGLNDLVIQLVDGPWILPVVALLSTIDGFFPAVPSESIVIAVAAVSVAGGGPPIWALILAAAVGAFLGDQIAFTIGRLIPVERIPFLNRGKTGEMLARANATISSRPAPLILAGRFIPGGRVAVNISAGAMGFPRLRFMRIDALAAVLWAAYSALLGISAGAYLANHPLWAAVVGVVLGIAMGLVIDRVARWWAKRRESARLG